MSLNKEELFNNCLDEINERIKRYQEKMDSISGNNAENKIVPDFDEYGNKGEILSNYENNAGYLDTVQEMKETLANLDREHVSGTIRPGSVVETKDNYYYISIPLGEVEMENGSQVYAISTDAPIYEHLEGKKAGDTFTFNNEEVEIIKVF